mmetsp:Transcript_39809/g.113684  ORF Transcript_39809/g.113684 Transcript_39809/m.113684 type:complete len:239 (-) Transcript_39809:52-768(-)
MILGLIHRQGAEVDVRPLRNAYAVHQVQHTVARLHHTPGHAVGDHQLRLPRFRVHEQCNAAASAARPRLHEVGDDIVHGDRMLALQRRNGCPGLRGGAGAHESEPLGDAEGPPRWLHAGQPSAAGAEPHGARRGWSLAEPLDPARPGVPAVDPPVVLRALAGLLRAPLGEPLDEAAVVDQLAVAGDEHLQDALHGQGTGKDGSQDAPQPIATDEAGPVHDRLPEGAHESLPRLSGRGE